MIRSNLSTRPFYNERAVRLVLLAVAALVALATLGNIAQVLRYSRSDTELATRASQDEARATELRGQATKLRASVDVKQVEVASLEARQANDLIDRRTFSWTQLLNLFETTLPDDVRITSVRPTMDDQGRIQLAITVLAQGVADVGEFMESLEASGEMRDAYVTSEQVTDGGQISAAMSAIYLPKPPAARGAAQPPAAAPAATTGPGAAQ